MRRRRRRRRGRGGIRARRYLKGILLVIVIKEDEERQGLTVVHETETLGDVICQGTAEEGGEEGADEWRHYALLSI